LDEKYGEQRYAAMRDHLRRFAESFGVSGMHIPERSPNTRAALALAEHARDQGRLHPARRALMDAFWRRGEDLEEPAVLSRCAVEAGLPPAAALAALEDPVLAARVDTMGREAARAGVTGIPTFLLGRRRVVGCHPYPVIAAEAEAEGARRK